MGVDHDDSCVYHLHLDDPLHEDVPKKITLTEAHNCIFESANLVMGMRVVRTVSLAVSD